MITDISSKEQTITKAGGMRPVIQADRDAAATAMCSKARNVAIEKLAYRIRQSENDDNTWVQALARHREASTAELVEALEKMQMEFHHMIGMASNVRLHAINERALKALANARKGTGS